MFLIGLALAGCGGATLVDGGDGVTGTTVVAVGTCLDEERRAALEAWLGALDTVDRSVAAPPDPSFTPLFFDVPGVTLGPWFGVDATCGGGLEPLCTGGVCFAADCDEGAVRVVAAPAADPWETDAGTLSGASQVLTAAAEWWTASWEVDAVELPGGEPFELVAEARLGRGLEVSGTVDRLVELTVSGGSGRVLDGSVVLATWDGERLLDADCVH